MAQIVTCPPAGCKTINTSACIFYEGPSLIYTGIKTNDSIEIALQKLDSYLQGGGISINTVTSYRSSFEVSDGKVYAGYLLNSVITITRTLDGILENATGLTNLEADWTNRLSLTYI